MVEMVDFRPSEIVSGAISGQNSIGVIAGGVVLSINMGGYSLPTEEVGNN